MVFDATKAPCQKNCQPKIISVAKGETVSEVLEKLEQEKIIKSALVAKIFLRFSKFNNQIQAGDFRLNPQNDLKTILFDLQKGTLDFWLTVTEGHRAEEVVEKIQKEEANVYKRSISDYVQQEGYLFPDTYLIPKNSSDKNIIEIFKKNFDSKLATLGISSTNAKVVLANKDQITLSELLSLASMVEREGRTENERQIIANVIYKRWKADWPLQIDATVQYAVGKPGEWWKKELTAEDLRINSPFNTYLNKGLPPSPICSPGLAAIKAVLEQKDSPFWFYSTGKDGVTRFAKTLEEHNSLVTKYGY